MGNNNKNVDNDNNNNNSNNNNKTTNKQQTTNNRQQHNNTTTQQHNSTQHTTSSLPPISWFPSTTSSPATFLPTSTCLAPQPTTWILSASTSFLLPAPSDASVSSTNRAVDAT